MQLTRLVVFLGLATPILGPDFDSAAIAKKALPAVVTIRIKTAAGAESSGSGFIVDPSGTIITNLHVIRGATSAAISPTSRTATSTTSAA